MKSYEILFTISTIIHTLALLFVIGGSIFYQTRRRSLEGILMIVSSIVVFVLSLGGSIIPYLFIANSGTETIIYMQAILNIVNGFFIVSFVIGFVMAIMKMSK